jgi:hypothetical protein
MKLYRSFFRAFGVVFEVRTNAPELMSSLTSIFPPLLDEQHGTSGRGVYVTRWKDTLVSVRTRLRRRADRQIVTA